MRRSNVRTVNCDNNPDKAGKMDPTKLQFRSNRPAYRFPYKQNTKSGLIFYTSIAFVAAIFCYVMFFSTSRSSDQSSVRNKYGIIIDGGSTGTRIHVFNYKVQDGIPRYDFGKNGLASMKVNPGLSAYAEKPEKAEAAIEELLEFGRKMVPGEYWMETDVRLMATAGMRLLDNAVQEKILDACRKVLSGSGFRFRDEWASVISGSDEGIYAWVVANYALGTLGGDPRHTTGIIELGGASAQVTFVSSEHLPPEYSSTVSYGNFTYNLYSHSLLQFGQNVAFDLLRGGLLARGQELATDSLQSGDILDPCTPRGYTHDIKLGNMLSSSAEKSGYIAALRPSGNFSECRSASLKLLQKDKEKCSYSNCYIGSTFIPKLQGKFLATENFFHTSKFFGLGSQAFLSHLMVAGQTFCEDDWSVLKSKYPLLDEEDLLRYCFSSAYIVALLHDSLGIALNDERIGCANQVKNIPLDWALGAFILQSTSSVDYEQESPSIASLIADDSRTLLLLFGIFLVCISTGWFFFKCRKPQLKTIYDLEKGKYIVTRVNRYS